MSKFRYFFIVAAFAFSSWTAIAQWTTQSITLEPGWNAIYVEVQPEPTDCASVFKNLPVESVWKWNRSFSSIDFDLDPDTLLPDDPHWLVWFPERDPHAFLSTLHNVYASSAYLVKLSTNAATSTLSIKGQPRLPSQDWYPHAVNFMGFPVSSSGSPTFSDLFHHTDEIDTTQGFDNELYELRTDGTTRRIVAPGREQVEQGVAYWIYASAEPDSPIPVEIDIGGTKTLDFGTTVTEKDLVIKNHSTTRSIDVDIQIQPSDSPPHGQTPKAGAVPLSIMEFDPSGPSWNWRALSGGETISVTVATNDSEMIRLAVRRADFDPPPHSAPSGSSYQSMLNISAMEDQLLFQVGVSASEAPLLLGAPTPSKAVHKGLWVGDVQLTQVSCPAYSSNRLLQADSFCEMRLLLHVDAYGDAQLLQEIFQAWVPLTETSGVYRLYGNKERIPDSATQISRISSAAFPRMAPCPMTGSITNELTTTVTLDCNNPSNPFLHRYHPLHDNQDWDGNTYTNAVETLTVQREIAMSFSSEIQEGSTAHPLWGYDILGGIYSEVVTGLRAQPVYSSGSFHLSRISQLDYIY